MGLAASAAFVEGPIPKDGIECSTETLREVPAFPNIVVLQTNVPAAQWSDGVWVDQERRRIVELVLAGPLGESFRAPVQWFYDPMAVTAFAGHLNERGIVYDSMDELSLFRGAPAELVRRERELLALADVVFAGGPKIWERRDYRELPGDVKSFDVCLMPFAMNEATRFINPTKALEYMATGCSIVSTPVEDVVRQFSEVVSVALDHEQFIRQCQECARQPDPGRIERGLALAQRDSSESIVGQLEGHVEDALTRKRNLTISAA